MRTMDTELENSDYYLERAISIFKGLNRGLGQRSFSPARECLAMQIATNLALTNHGLKSSPVCWIDPATQQLCKTLLSNFARIDQTRTKGRLKKTSVIAFFKATNSEHLIRMIDDNCSRLYKLLDGGSDDSVSVPDSLNPGSKNHLDGIGRHLLNALEQPLNTESLSQLSKLEASFHSGRIVRPANWLEDLYSIGEAVAIYRRQHKLKSKIRVAILDTGVDEGDKKTTTWRIKTKRDFVNVSAVEMTDDFGHGTLMAKFVMNCAPSAELIIARVAKSTEDLKDSQENIKEALLWAGITCQADIISMSFGFPKDHVGIQTAIGEVQSKRKGSVLFLASAGNSSSEDENFPARHSSVISIHAANCRGTFLETSPQLPNGAPAIWGTYGSDIPNEFVKDVQRRYPKVCQPGSSIATAVAAGISATMLAYADLLPHLDASAKEGSASSRLRLLRMKDGMEALFMTMTKENGGSRQRFIDPISFWRETSEKDQDTTKKEYAKHHARYCEIHACLRRVSTRQADGS